jgi:hypothetical protein
MCEVVAIQHAMRQSSTCATDFGNRYNQSPIVKVGVDFNRRTVAGAMPVAITTANLQPRFPWVETHVYLSLHRSAMKTVSAAPPPDLRKGSAFPLSALSIYPPRLRLEALRR